MSEGIDLPAVARGTLLPEDERVARLEYAMPQILAAVAGERDPIVVQATLACLLWETMSQASWVGFYRRVAEKLLSVGPYQGTMGCLHIALDRGVCGACARTGRTQLVADVRAVADHIACDGATLSELVVPVHGRGMVQAVLDLDSRELAAFSPAEAVRLEALVADAFGDHVAWRSSAARPESDQ
jgi:GAF domain-containing protein